MYQIYFTKAALKQLTAYSRRINVQHRLVYQVLEEEQAVKILSLWTHYEF